MGQEDFCPAKKFRGQKKCLPFFKAGCTLPSTPIGGALVSTGTWKPELQVEAPLASLKAAKTVIANEDNYAYACAA